jgi:hypothetical protein
MRISSALQRTLLHWLDPVLRERRPDFVIGGGADP